MPQLNRKWKAFVEEYLRLNWNGTRAYKAIYGEHLSDETAAPRASKLLRNDKIKDYLSQRIAERAMGADEVLARLGEHARVDIGDFYEPGTNTVNMRRARELGLTKLIKKVKQTVKTTEDEEIIFTEIELVDGQAALVHLGRHHKLFTDVVDNTTTLNITGKEELLDRVYGSRDTDTDSG